MWLELQCLCASIVQCQHPSSLCPCQPGASLSPFFSPLHIPVVSLAGTQAMIRENWQLVTDEPVEFEN